MEIDRMNIIGASEVPAILGIDEYMTPLKLWGIKTGTIPADDLSGNESVQWGKKLERIVSDDFAEKHGVKLMAYKQRYHHATMPFFSCELDNIIVGTKTIVEIKTVGAQSWKKWENPDEIPPKVIAQVTAQMGLSKREDAWVYCLCGGQRTVEKYLKFDAELYAMIETKVAEFWKMVQDKTPPFAIGADNPGIVDIYPKSGELIQAVEEMNASIALLQQTKANIKALDATKDELEAKLKQVIGENAGIRTSQYVAKWIQVKGSTFQVTKKDGKMLKITLNKEKKDE